MKNLSLIFIFLFAVFIPNISQSFNSTPSFTPIDGNKEIFLDGTLDDSASRSPQQKPIKATMGLSTLYVDFLNNIGDIDIEVHSTTGGSVYENNVNTQTQGSLSIDVSNWNNDTYQIRFVNSNEEYLQGIFKIQ